MNTRSSGQTAVGTVEPGTGKGALGARARYRTMLGFGLGLVMVWGAAGCHKTTAQGTASNAAEQNGSDPANANMAPDSGYGQPAQVLGQSAQNEAQQQAEDYSQQPPAPIERRAPYTGDPGPNGGYVNNTPPPDYGADITDQQAADLYESDLTDEQASEAPHRCRNMISPPLQMPITFGHRATGDGVPKATTGFRVRGLRLRMRARSGPLATGDSMVGAIASITDSGDCTLGSTSALTMALDTSAMDTMAAIGTTITSATTRQ